MGLRKITTALGRDRMKRLEFFSSFFLGGGGWIRGRCLFLCDAYQLEEKEPLYLSVHAKIGPEPDLEGMYMQ